MCAGINATATRQTHVGVDGDGLTTAIVAEFDRTHRNAGVAIGAFVFVNHNDFTQLALHGVIVWINQIQPFRDECQ